MKIAYISENKMFLCENGTVRELQSERAAQYSEFSAKEKLAHSLCMITEVKYEN